MAWVLVTGGAKRVGAAICQVLAENKYNLLVHYLSGDKEAEKVVAECRAQNVSAEFIRGDFSSAETTQAFINEVNTQYPDIEHLINNVGNFLPGPASKIPIQEWQNLFQTNFFGPIALIQGFLPNIRKRQGTIINLGTAGVSSMRADSKYAAYTATKAALFWLTKSLARELAPDKVRVNMVSPGQLDISVDHCSVTPLMGRYGVSREIGEVIAFLLKAESSYITGQNIEVAGALAL
jgi:NAD(P)-dependent dehydrogenase (short-subunit alcohol dehydrogenase family)